MMKTTFLATAAAVTLMAAPAVAQSTNGSTGGNDRIGQILGSIFGFGTAADTSLEAQWNAGQSPLAIGRAEFESRIDADVRSGTLTFATGTRLKADYAELVALEARYGADRRFTSAEQSDLGDRFGTLTQILSEGRYTDTTATIRAEVGEGKFEFDRRVDAAISARRITRVAGTRLKADYASLVQVENGYLRDGVLSEAERNDLDNRLDALDARVGDTVYTAVVTYKTRLDAIARALPTSGLTATARTQLQVEHGDLVRLESAYARITPTADERAYLERRLVNLEMRARVNR